MNQRKKRIARVSKEKVRAKATEMATFNVKWSRPGLDNVRVGKGYARGVNADGSLDIIDDDGKIRAILPEFVSRQLRIETKRSIRHSWRKWCEDDTNDLLEFKHDLESRKPEDDEEDDEDE